MQMKFKTIFALALIAYGPLAFGSATITNAGDSLPRDVTNATSIPLKIKIDNLAVPTDAENIGTDTAKFQEFVKTRLQITFDSVVMKDSANSDTDNYYVDPTTISGSTASPATNVVAYYINLTIRETAPKGAGTIHTYFTSHPTSAVVHFKLLNKDTTSPTTAPLADTDITFTIVTDIPKQAPDNFAIGIADRKIKVTFTKQSPTVTGYSGTLPTPNIVVLFWKELNQGGVEDIGAKAFGTTSDTDVTGCDYTDNFASGEDCIIGDACAIDQKVYLTSPGETGKNGIYSADLTDASGGTTGFLSTDSTKQYAVWAQYSMGGARTKCYIGSPGHFFSLTELNGEADAEQVDFRCFIATAAFGSPFHKYVTTFRWFRDHVLLRSKLGKSFVHSYYKFSPPLAAAIATHPLWAKVSRAVLLPFAWGIQGLQWFFLHRLAGVGLLLLAGVGLVSAWKRIQTFKRRRNLRLYVVP